MLVTATRKSRISLCGFCRGKGLFPHHVPIHLIPGYDQINWNAKCIIPDLWTNSSLTTPAMQNIFTQQLSLSRVKNKKEAHPEYPRVLAVDLYCVLLTFFLEERESHHRKSNGLRNIHLCSIRLNVSDRYTLTRAQGQMWTQCLRRSQSLRFYPFFQRNDNFKIHPPLHSFIQYSFSAGAGNAWSTCRIRPLKSFGLTMPRHSRWVN